MCAHAHMLGMCRAEDSFAEFCLSAPLCGFWGVEFRSSVSYSQFFHLLSYLVRPQVRFNLLWEKVVGPQLGGL